MAPIEDIVRRSTQYIIAIIALTIVCLLVVIFSQGLLITIIDYNAQIIITASIILMMAIIMQIRQTRVSVLNARLAIELSEKQAIIDTDLKTAQLVQQAILPTPPTLEGFSLAAHCQTADKVGGDFYHFLNDEDQCGIIIGDVSGHGVSSALVMALCEGIINEMGTQSPHLVLTEINNKLIHYLNGSKYVTLIIAVLDKKTGVLTYANAGHPEPVLWNARTATVEKLQGNGTMVGIFTDESFSSYTYTLQHGDIILFYTDGFSEARKADGTFVGEDSLIEFLQSHITEDTASILQNIFTQTGMQSPYLNDDRAAVILKKI